MRADQEILWYYLKARDEVAVDYVNVLVTRYLYVQPKLDYKFDFKKQKR